LTLKRKLNDTTSLGVKADCEKNVTLSGCYKVSDKLHLGLSNKFDLDKKLTFDRETFNPKVTLTLHH